MWWVKVPFTPGLFRETALATLTSLRSMIERQQFFSPGFGAPGWVVQPFYMDWPHPLLKHLDSTAHCPASRLLFGGPTGPIQAVRWYHTLTQVTFQVSFTGTHSGKSRLPSVPRNPPKFQQPCSLPSLTAALSEFPLLLFSHFPAPSPLPPLHLIINHQRLHVATSSAQHRCSSPLLHQQDGSFPTGNRIWLVGHLIQYPQPILSMTRLAPQMSIIISQSQEDTL